MTSFKIKTFSSVKWSFAEKFGQTIISIIISIILARLLGPEEFAAISVLNIFTTISLVLIDSGFSQGLIRKQNCNQNDYNSIFWFNLFASLIIYLFLFFIIPYFLKYLDLSDIIFQSRILLLIIPIQALNIIQTTIINKELDFKKIAKYTIISTIISGFIGIVMAFIGCGLWSLITQILLNGLLSAIFFWIKSDWRPILYLDFKIIKELFPFSFKLSLSSLINVIFNNIYVFIIAKLYPINMLGYYTQAQKYSTAPTNLVESILNRITYPILSTLQNDKLKYREIYKKIQIIVFDFVVPMMTFFIIIGNEFILIVLGDKWQPSIYMFLILCIASVTFPMHPLAMSTLKVFGFSDIILRLEIVKKIIFIVSIISGIPFGIMGFIYGQVFYFWISLLINIFYSGKIINYKFKDQLYDLFPSLAVAFLCYLISNLISLITDNIIVLLILKTIYFLTFYLIFLFSFRKKYIYELPALLKKNK